MARKPSLIALANQHVPIGTVCRLIGMDTPADAGDLTYSGRMKLHCPFGHLYHGDGGVEAAMRIYPDHAYCFRCAAYFTPVKLAAQAWDVTWSVAAARLLDAIGYRPLSLAEQWADVVDPVREPDTTMLAEALKTYCRRVDPGWSVRQYDPAVSAALTRCLGLLDLVHADQDAARWLGTCKQVMARVLQTEVVG